MSKTQKNSILLPYFNMIIYVYECILTWLCMYIKYINAYALSFYVTKTVLVGPKLFWSDQIYLDVTIVIWSRPKWIGLVQIVIFYQNESHLDLTISFCSWPNHYGQVQINLVRPKPFWIDQNCFGHIEGQDIITLLSSP